MSQQTAKNRKPRSRERGKYKLGVYFIDHQSRDGRAYYFHSNRAQDVRGIAINRFKRMVLQKWKDLVSWAGIYEEGVLIHEFKLEDNEWVRK